MRKFRKFLKWLGIGFIAFVVIAYVITDMLTYYPEVYKLKGIRMALFSIKNKSTYGAWDLQRVYSVTEGSDSLIVGIRFTAEYISQVHEHPFIGKKRGPWGYYGHLDSMIDLKANAGDHDLTSSLGDATMYTNFNADNILDSGGDSHRIGGSWEETYYIAQTYRDADKLVAFYNDNKSEPYVPIEDYRFFVISKQQLASEKGKWFKVSFLMSDGRVVADSLRL